MSTQNLAALDVDGALQEGIAAVENTRAGFLGKAAVAAGGLIGGGAVMAALPGGASAAFNARDKSILNFALTLEYLEATFYERSLKHAGLKGPSHHFASTVYLHESQHVRTLKKVLGSQAIKKPKFDFGAAVQSPSAFLATSQKLENTGVKAYKGQAPRLESDTLLKAALSIHSIEAKHAAWVTGLLLELPSPTALDGPLTMDEVLAAVKATGFIVG